MDYPIPQVVDELYRYYITSPDPKFWPDYFRDDPVQGHGLWSFYRGLQLGMQVAKAGLELG